MKRSTKPIFQQMLLLLVAISIASTGCSNVKQLRVHATPTDLPAPETTPRLPLPAPIRTLPVDLIPQGDKVCLALSSYHNLVLNEAEFLRWVKEARYRLDLCNGERRHEQ